MKETTMEFPEKHGKSYVHIKAVTDMMKCRFRNKIGSLGYCFPRQASAYESQIKQSYVDYWA